MAQFEIILGLEFRVYAARNRLKAELRTKLSHHQNLTFLARIEGVAQTVAEKIQGKQHRREHGSGENNQPPINADGIDLFDAAGNERTEAGLRRLNAETEITQE